MKHAKLIPPLITLLLSSALANHGPGTSGGGSSTTSGETMKQGKSEVSFRLDYTQFEDISRAEAARIAGRTGDFDSLSDSVVASIEAAYGITDDLQLSGQIGYYWGSGFLAATSEGGGPAEIATVDPNGLTDLWINGKYRFLKGKPGNLALIAGIKLPAGRDDVKLSNGQPLEPSSQPGSGSVDYQIGLGYSRFLTSQITIDASTIYTFRMKHDGFEVGDRFDFGTAVAYRLTESIKSFPQYSIFGELTGVWLGKDHSEDEGTNQNSGGTTLYLSPGLRVRFNPQWSLTAAFSVPIMQDLNAEQIETTYKATLALSWSL
jgi:hypothetical protein